MRARPSLTQARARKAFRRPAARVMLIGQSMGRRQRIGQQLIERGRISADQLDAALAMQKQFHGRLGTNLIELGVLRVDELAEELGRQLGVPAALREHFCAADRQLFKQWPKRAAAAYAAVPLAMVPGRKNTMQVAMMDPHDLRAIEELEFAVGCRFEVLVAPEARIQYVKKKLWGVESTRRTFIRMDIDLEDLQEAYAAIRRRERLEKEEAAKPSLSEMPPPKLAPKKAKKAPPAKPAAPAYLEAPEFSAPAAPAQGTAPQPTPKRAAPQAPPAKPAAPAYLEAPEFSAPAASAPGTAPQPASPAADRGAEVRGNIWAIPGERAPASVVSPAGGHAGTRHIARSSPARATRAGVAGRCPCAGCSGAGTAASNVCDRYRRPARPSGSSTRPVSGRGLQLRALAAH